MIRYKRSKLKYMNFKFDNFSELQNVISDSPPPANVVVTHCVQKSICCSPLRCVQVGKIFLKASIFGMTA